MNRNKVTEKIGIMVVNINALALKLMYIFIFILCFSAYSYAADYYVGGASGDNSNDGSDWDNAFATIQKGLDDADNGDTVIVHDGTYTGDGNKNLDFNGKEIYLKSENGSDVCTIDLEGSGQAIFFQDGETSNTKVEGFTIKNGSTAYGGGIRCSNSDPVIEDCIIEHCVGTTKGGGIYASGSSISIVDCVIQFNCSNGYGGGLYAQSTADISITGTVFETNCGTSAGGIYFNCSKLEIDNCHFLKNKAKSYYGGGIYSTGDNVTITSVAGETIFENNTAYYSGGGIFCSDNTTLLDVKIRYNEADVQKGGGIYYQGGSDRKLYIYGCEISNNYQTHYYSNYGGAGIYKVIGFMEVYNTVMNSNCSSNIGGAVMCYAGESYFENCAFINNKAGSGGAIYCSTNGGCASIINCNIENNSCTSSGAGIFTTGIDAVTIENTCITSNQASSHAGGFYLSSTDYVVVRGCNIDNNTGSVYGGGAYIGGNSEIEIDNCTVRYNEVTHAIGRGAGLNIDGVNGLIINNTVVSFNESIYYGGGVYLGSSTSGQITNCEFENNSAARGGGIYAATANYRKFSGCVIRYNNSTGCGGGIYINGDQELQNCTVEFNTSIDDGGGICNDQSVSSFSISINGCIIRKNTSGDLGGGVYVAGCNTSPLIIDTLVENNSATSGGGIYLYWNDTPSINGCIIRYNEADYDGGGVVVYHQAPIFGSCVFTQNIAEDNGGAIAGMVVSNIATPFIFTVDNCTFNSNESGDTCGAISSDPDCYPLVTSCTIERNVAYNGAGMYIFENSSDTISDSTLRSNVADNYGGGLYLTASDSIVSDCTIENNHAKYGGGVYVSDEISPTFNGNVITKNISTYNGAGISSTGCDIILDNCTIEHNIASTGEGQKGGGIHLTDVSSPIITNCVFDNNTCRSGAGLSAQDNVTAVINGCVFKNNDAAYGAGLHCDGYSDVVLDNCTFSGNIASSDGGGANYANGNGSITGCIFENNQSVSAAGLALSSNANIPVTNCTFQSNTGSTSGSAKGGGIDCLECNPTISRCTFNNNTIKDGGAISCYSSNATILDCVIENCNATDQGGGIIFDSGSIAQMTNTSISNNIAENGAGIRCQSNSSVTLQRCLVANNVASSSGGGLDFNWGNGTIVNSTFANNEATSNGAGLNVDQSAYCQARNVIVWSNTAGGDGDEICLGATATLDISYCCIGNSSGDLKLDGSVNISNCITSDPCFVDGASGDFHLNSVAGHWTGTYFKCDANTSPCIDAGDPGDNSSFEPWWGKDRINIGVYGNTVATSRSPFYVPTMTNDSDTFSSTRPDILEITVGANGNPDNTTVRVWYALDNNGAPGEFKLLGAHAVTFPYYLDWENGNDTYYFKCQAYNGFTSWTDNCSYVIYTIQPENHAPLKPSNLAVNGTEGNVTDLSDPSPYFTAKYNDDDTTDYAISCVIQVTNTASTWTASTMVWNSGDIYIWPAEEDTSCIPIYYDGDTLEHNTTYYWRIKFADMMGCESDFSDEIVCFVTDNDSTTLGFEEEKSISEGVTIHYDNLTIGNGATLTIGNNAVVIVAGEFKVEDNGTVIIDGAAEIRAVDITVEEGGLITADGKGWNTTGKGADSASGPGGGGGMGGAGGDGGGANGGQGGVKHHYTLVEDMMTGSPGGQGSDVGCDPGLGGGFITLKAEDTLTVNGEVSADGTDGEGSSTGPSGGGSGGKIIYYACNIAGTGVFSVDGGDGGDGTDGADGAGGGSAGVTYGMVQDFDSLTWTLVATPGDAGDGLSCGDTGFDGIVFTIEDNIEIGDQNNNCSGDKGGQSEIIIPDDVGAPGLVGFEPVHTNIGCNYLPVNIVAAGVDISLEINYNKTNSEELGTMGYGWSHTYEMCIKDWDNGTKLLVDQHGAGVLLFPDTEYGDSSILYRVAACNHKYGTMLENSSAEYDYVLTWADQVVYKFNSDGQIARIEDCTPDDYLEVKYVDGLIDCVSDFTGRVITFSYSTVGLLDSITMPDGNSVSITRNLDNEVSDIDGWGFTYGTRASQDHVLLEREDKLGNKVTIDVDNSTGWVNSITDNLGNSVTYTKGENPFEYTRMDAENRTYEKRYNPVNKISPVTIDGLERVTTKEFGEFRNVTRRIYPNGTYDVNEFDNRGNLTETWSYDACDQLLTYSKYDYSSTNDLLNSWGPVSDPEDNTQLAATHTSYQYNATGQITRITRPGGVVTEYTYNAQGQKVDTIVDPDNLALTTRNTYGSDGLQNGTILDPDGLCLVTRFVRDGMGRIVETIDPMGYSTKITFDNQDRVETTISPTGMVTKYEYNENGQLEKVIADYGNLKLTTQNVYDNNGQLIERIIDPDGVARKTSYQKDKSGMNIATVIDPDNVASKTEIFLDENGDSEKTRNWLTASDSTDTEYYRDSMGTVNLTVLDATDKEVDIQTIFDDQGRIVQAIGAEVATNEQYYDDLGRNYRSVDSFGKETFRTYDSAGRVKTQLTHGEVLTTYTYDSAGRVVSTNVKAERHSITTYKTYDSAGRVTREWVEGTNGTTYTYDANGRVTSVVNGDGIESVSEYDNAGRVVATRVDPYGEDLKSVNVYDTAGRLVTKYPAFNSDTCNISIVTVYNNASEVTSQYTDSDTYATKLYYDSAGRQWKVEDANGNTTENTYDKAGRLTCVTYSDGNSVDFEYDNMGNKTKVKDELDNETTFTYDDLGRKLSMTDPLGNSTYWTYGPGGLVDSMTDPNGTTFYYDYDERGNLLEVSFAGCSRAYSYDALGRIETVYGANMDLNNTATNHETTYNSIGQITEVVDKVYSDNWNDGEDVTYTFGLTETGRQDNVSVAIGLDEYALFMEYDNAGRLTTIRKDAVDGDVVATYVYNDLGQRTTFYRGTSESNKGYTSYTYNNRGLLTKLENKDSNGTTVSSFEYGLDKTGNRDNMTYMNGKYVTYTYNSRYWLTGEFYYNSDDFPIDNMSYIYSATGNRLQQFQNGGTLVQEMTYNAFNQLVEEKDCASGVTYAYYYDANGNLTSKTGDDGSEETFTYNYENRQIGWTDGTTEQRTAFDGTTSNRISFDDNGNVLIMVYLGNDVIQDRDDTFSLKKEYITPDLDENLMMIIPAGEDNAGSYYYFQDGLGSVVELRDSSENTVNSYKYRAFGASNGTATQGIVNRYQYTGRENNGHGQQYSRERNYILSIGRFATPDPILHPNLFYYSSNNPINLIDPYGLKPSEKDVFVRDYTPKNGENVINLSPNWGKWLYTEKEGWQFSPYKYKEENTIYIWENDRGQWFVGKKTIEYWREAPSMFDATRGGGNFIDIRNLNNAIDSLKKNPNFKVWVRRLTTPLMLTQAALNMDLIYLLCHGSPMMQKPGEPAVSLVSASKSERPLSAIHHNLPLHAKIFLYSCHAKQIEQYFSGGRIKAGTNTSWGIATMPQVINGLVEDLKRLNQNNIKQKCSKTNLAIMASYLSKNDWRRTILEP